MTDKIINITFPKCGTCFYAQKFDNKDAADCFGLPPTVLLLGQTRDAIGRPAMQLETFVPRVQSDRRACSLHKPKEDFATAGSS